MTSSFHNRTRGPKWRLVTPWEDMIHGCPSSKEVVNLWCKRGRGLNTVSSYRLSRSFLLWYEVKSSNYGCGWGVGVSVCIVHKVPHGRITRFRVRNRTGSLQIKSVVELETHGWMVGLERRRSVLTRMSVLLTSGRDRTHWVVEETVCHLLSVWKKLLQICMKVCTRRNP